MFLDKDVMVPSAALRERLSGDDSEDCTTSVSLMLHLIDRKENGDLGAATSWRSARLVTRKIGMLLFGNIWRSSGLARLL